MLKKTSGLNRAMFGFRRFGFIRFREKYLTTYTFSKLSKGTKIIVYDRNDLKIEEIGDDTQKGILGNCTFELIEKGCGFFSFELLDNPQHEILHNYRIDIHLFGDIDPWYSGEIFKRPRTGSTKKPYKYSGYGFVSQLDTCKVNQRYNATTFPTAADREVGAVADHTMRTYIEPETKIVYAASKIVAAGFTITDVNFARTSAQEAVEQLANAAQNYQYGVDEDREFFFRAIDTDVNADAIRSVGKNVNDFTYREPDSEKVINEIDVLNGEITDKSNYITTVSDATSQATYGKRWGRYTIPVALTLSDAERIANYQLSILKDPETSATLKNVEIISQTRIPAEGKARIFDKDGTKYEMYIKKVKYNISSKGITMDWTLGEIDIPFENEILKLLRNIENQALLQAANVAQLS